MDVVIANRRREARSRCWSWASARVLGSVSSQPLSTSARSRSRDRAPGWALVSRDELIDMGMNPMDIRVRMTPRIWQQPE